MGNITIEATDETPYVILDKVSGQLFFSGKSLPEDVSSFYSPILEWIEGYIANPLNETEVIFKMDYFNTASSKIILDILIKLEDINLSGNQLLVKWHYKTDDIDMKEAGEEYSDIVDVVFDIIAY